MFPQTDMVFNLILTSSVFVLAFFLSPLYFLGYTAIKVFPQTDLTIPKAFPQTYKLLDFQLFIEGQYGVWHQNTQHNDSEHKK